MNSTTSNNIIGKECFIEGNITTSGNLRIEGHVIGKIQAKSKIVLGQTAQVQGHIMAQNAEISGHVKGSIKTEKLLILKSTAIMEGDIVSSKLIFEEGSCFDGKCTMNQTKPIEQPLQDSQLLSSKPKALSTYTTPTNLP